MNVGQKSVMCQSTMKLISFDDQAHTSAEADEDEDDECEDDVDFFSQ